MTVVLVHFPAAVGWVIMTVRAAACAMQTLFRFLFYVTLGKRDGSLPEDVILHRQLLSIN